MIDVDLALPTSRISNVLDRVAGWRGHPQVIRTDNGPEFISTAAADWEKVMRLRFSLFNRGSRLRALESRCSTELIGTKS